MKGTVYTAGMATTARISIEEYLRTSYRPDREYIDGELRERNVGKWAHSRVQAWLAAWFLNHEQKWRILTATEWRTRVSLAHVRLPDVVLVSPGRQTPVLEKAPVLVVEILSPGDTYDEMKKRALDYRNMGSQAIWIIDPDTQTGEMLEGASWRIARRLTVPGSPIYVELEDLFRCLDVDDDN